METNTIIAIVVAVVVVLLLLALAAFLTRRRKARNEKARLHHAEQLRGAAAGRTADVQSAERAAQSADVQAERARAEAAQAERVAADARRDLAREQAAQEDVVRQADRVDPRVDTSADDYRPVTGPDMKSSTVDPVVTDDEGKHRA